jgi:hypothetical protein
VVAVRCRSLIATPPGAVALALKDADPEPAGRATDPLIELPLGNGALVGEPPSVT